MMKLVTYRANGEKIELFAKIINPPLSGGIVEANYVGYDGSTHLWSFFPSINDSVVLYNNAE